VLYIYIYIYIYVSNNNFYHFFLQRKGILQILKISTKHQGFIYLFIYSLIHLLIHLFIHLFIHLLIHSFIYSFIHSFIHSFILFFSLHFIDSLFITLFTGNALCTHTQQHSKKPPQRLGGISENKSDIILIENIAFNYLLINYFSIGHQVSPLKPLLD
jgi:hypothetical protein